MRRLVVLALLLGGMQLIQPLGVPGFGARALLTFGFLILGAYAAGELAASVGIPKLVGYLGAGIIFGPWTLGTVGGDSVTALAPVSSLAIALIAFLAGSELRVDEIRSRVWSILRILSVEIALTLVAITVVLMALARDVPFLAGAGPVETLAFSLLFASIAVVHSPAVTMALLNETRARGPLARTALGVVMLSNVLIVFLLTATLTLARLLVPLRGPGTSPPPLAAVAWQIIGAVIVGAALGALVALYLRVARRDLFLFAIFVAFFGAEVARLAHVEPLLTLIVAGFVAENVSMAEHGQALRAAMQRAAAPVFVVFFALSGAQIVLPDLARYWPLVLPLMVVRAASIWTGCRLGTRWTNARGAEAPVVRRYLWTALISQAGVAIGLAATVADVYPARGSEIRTIFLTLVAANEAVGAIAFRRALQKSGEIPTVGVRAPAAESAAG